MDKPKLFLVLGVVISFVIALIIFIYFDEYKLSGRFTFSISIFILISSIVGLIYFKKWEILVSSIIFVIVTELILLYLFPLILIPKTEIEVLCIKNSNEGYIRFEFENIADFAGEDFNIDILDKNITQKVSFNPWIGKLCDSNFIISDPISRANMGMRIKCEYIPPKTTIRFDVYTSSMKNFYKIQYYSKTTKFIEKEVVCN